MRITTTTAGRILQFQQIRSSCDSSIWYSMLSRSGGTTEKQSPINPSDCSQKTVGLPSSWKSVSRLFSLENRRGRRER